mmetsp:Transcript_128026/g.273003  ORF Transcript_128026/g.273003 Transcript_128026/m.273003 type:complete len:228 (+) Transcript_128026:556-1239(+)
MLWVFRGSSQVELGAAWKSHKCASPVLAFKPNACAIVDMTWCKCHRKSIFNSISLGVLKQAGLSAKAVSSGRSSFTGTAGNETSFVVASFPAVAADCNDRGPQWPLETTPSMQRGWRLSCKVMHTSMEFDKCAARSATLFTGYIGTNSSSLVPGAASAAAGVRATSPVGAPGATNCQMITSPDQSCSFLTVRFVLRGWMSLSLNSSQHSQVRFTASSGKGATSLLLT